MKKSIMLLSLLVFSCAKQEDKQLDEVTMNYDNAVVIAKAEYKGRSDAAEIYGSLSDCADGLGVGITVESSTEDSSFIFNKQGQSCKTAQVLYDGDQKAYSRSADPTIDIVFNDKYGKVSPLSNAEKNAQRSVLFTNSDLDYNASSTLAERQYQDMGRLSDDYKPLKTENDDNLQQQAFEKMLSESLLQKREEDLAEVRRIVQQNMLANEQKLNADKQQLALHKQLHQEESQKALARLTQTSEELNQALQELNSIKAIKQVQANNYEQQLRLLEKRVEDYAQLALMLKHENQRLANSANQANEFISKDLNQAELDADNARYVAMLKLAEDIQTDEKFAKALEYSQKKSIFRKAQRLQTQADTLNYHATADKVFDKQANEVYQQLQNNMQPAFEGKRARVVGVAINKEPSLADVQLLLSEKGRSVNDILNDILNDVKPVLGTWQIDWKLATHNQQIQQEKWNVSAEITLIDFFDFIKTRVKEIHGLDLSIEQFPETRKIVITDSF